MALGILSANVTGLGLCIIIMVALWYQGLGNKCTLILGPKLPRVSFVVCQLPSFKSPLLFGPSIQPLSVLQQPLL
jgi:hypothetical protein